MKKSLAWLKREIKVGSVLYCNYCHYIEQYERNVDANEKIDKANGTYDEESYNKSRAEISTLKERMYNSRKVDSVHSNYITIEGSRLDWPKAKDIVFTDDGFEIWSNCENAGYIKILAYTIIKF